MFVRCGLIGQKIIKRSLHAASASKNNNTRHTAQPVSMRCATAQAAVVCDAYDCAVCCVLLFLYSKAQQIRCTDDMMIQCVPGLQVADGIRFLLRITKNQSDVTNSGWYNFLYPISTIDFDFICDCKISHQL